MHYTLIDNWHLNLYVDFSENENSFLQDEKKLIVLGKDVLKGTWHIHNETITLIQQDDTVVFSNKVSEFSYLNQTWYSVTDNELQTEIILILTFAINFRRVQQQNKGRIINAQGFGKGFVFKNFQTDKPIRLS
jgi:hypothetical protein